MPNHQAKSIARIPPIDPVFCDSCGVCKDSSGEMKQEVWHRKVLTESVIAIQQIISEPGRETRMPTT